MQKTIVVLIFSFMVTSCGPASKLKKAERLIKKAVMKGAKVDTLKTYVRDTVRIRGFEGSFQLDLKVNPSFVVRPCEDLVNAKTDKKKQKAVEEIQQLVCPPINVDTTYIVKLNAQGGEYSLPIHIKILNGEAGFNYSIVSGNLNVPITTQKNSVSVKAGYTVWDLIKAGLLGLVVGALTGYLLSKFKII